MIVNPERVAALTVVVGWALIDFLWQGLLVGLLIAAMLRALRSRSADLRYGLACAGFLVMATCPAATVLRLATSTPPAVAPPSVATTANVPDASIRPSTPPSTITGVPRHELGYEPERTEPADSRWPVWVEARLPMIVALWLAGVGLMAVRLALGLVEVRRLTRGGLLTPDGELRDVIARLTQRSGIRRPVGWFLTLRVEVPTVVGWLRPTVLIPAANAARLTLRQLEALLAHEIAHIRRHDYLVNLIQAAIETILFYHPAVWWVSGRIRAERENACDDAAAALCNGDRLLVARALFAMEERRSAPGLALAASGGSLKDRIRRLVAPTSAGSRPSEAGWAVGALLIAASAILATNWLSGPSRAHDEVAGEEPEQVAVEEGAALPIRGRVLDEEGRPVAGSRVRLYRRDSRWEHRHPVVVETTAGPDGAFRLVAALKTPTMAQSRGLPPYVLVADHPGKAVGWATIPMNAAAFESDLVLTPATERAVHVADADGRPVSGARVTVSILGDPSSSDARFREVLELRPEDGPLAADTDGEGRAAFSQLPKTYAWFVATKPGFAESFAASRKLDVIRLTPGARLSGRVTGPDGKPVSGVKVVLFTGFMWDFEHARTDVDGRYQFEDLRAKGWDMSTWTPGQKADGSYKLWLDDERVATTTRSLVLESNSSQTLDIQAEKPGVIRATVVEKGTNRPLAGVRIWGYDAETGGSSRFIAYTDEQGLATFYSVAANIMLAIAGPPEGYYIDAASRASEEGMVKQIDFAGGEQEITLTMPPLLGKLGAVQGTCRLPDGSPAADATVYATAGRFATSQSKNFIRRRVTDASGRFALDELPSGRTVRFYAETAGGAFAGDAAFETPEAPDPLARVDIPLKRTVAVERVLVDSEGKPLASRKFLIVPSPGGEDSTSFARELPSNAEGRIKVDRIVPGLSYHIREIEPPSADGRADNQPRRVYITKGGRLPWYDEVVVLAPADGGG